LLLLACISNVAVGASHSPIEVCHFILVDAQDTSKFRKSHHELFVFILRFPFNDVIPPIDDPDGI
jgi:hypothetical protein